MDKAKRLIVDLEKAQKSNKESYFSLASEDVLLGDVERYIPLKLGYVDKIFGGGIPCGRMVELAGKFSVGKSALAEFIGRRFQENGGTVVYFPFEPALQKKHLQSYSINLDNFIIADPKTADAAIRVIRRAIKSLKQIKKEGGDPLTLFVWDSVSASQTYAEIKDEDKDKQTPLPMALARLFGDNLRALRRQLAKVDSTLLFVNQHRDKIGGMTSFGYKPSSRPGGGALKHCCSQMSTLKRIETLKKTVEKQTVKYGYRIKIKIDKNHFAPPEQECEFILNFSNGVDPVLTLLEIAKEKKIIMKAGAYWKFMKKNYTLSNLVNLFSENFNEFYEKVIKHNRNKKNSKK